MRAIPQFVALLALAAAVMAMPDPDSAPVLEKAMVDAINADGEYVPCACLWFADLLPISSCSH